jgi:hypothetical protein
MALDRIRSPRARGGAATLASALVLAVSASCASAQSPFYAGKQLSMLINFGAGSSTDIEARLFGKHIAKHIEGHPTFIMQNKPGAGGLTGGLYLGEIAPKDGSIFGYMTALGSHYTTQPKAFRADLKSYEFVAYSSGAAIYFIRSDVPPGIKKAEDIAKAGFFVSGGVNALSGRDLTIRLTLDMLGRKYKHVSGYGSGEKTMLALQRSEIHFYSTTPPLYRGQIVPNLVNNGLVTPLYVDPSWDGKTLAMSKQVADLGVLQFQDLYKKIHGNMPEGAIWQAYLTVIRLNGNLQRFITFPPGAPKAAVEALKVAVRKLNTDKAYAEDSHKALGFVPEFEVGDDTPNEIRSALTLQPEVKDFIANYVRAK